MEKDRPLDSARPMTRFGVPMVEWRRRRPLLVLFVCSCMVALAAQALPRPWPQIALPPTLSLSFLCSAYVLVSAPRLERNVRPNNYEVCTNCGYSLTGLPDVHVCPECGLQYDKDDLRRVWGKRLRYGAGRLLGVMIVLTALCLVVAILMFERQRFWRAVNSTARTQPLLIEDPLSEDK